MFTITRDYDVNPESESYDARAEPWHQKIVDGVRCKGVPVLLDERRMLFKWQVVANTRPS